MTPLVRSVAGGLLVAVVAGGLFLTDLGRCPLLDPDEARHVEVARELGAARGIRGVFLPTLELQPYREKPAGWYWLVAAAEAALGRGEAAARSVSALAALVGVLVIYAYALRGYGATGAIGAGLVAATSAGWLGLARYANLDMALTACVAIGVLAGLSWLERPAPRRPPLAPWVAAGVGMLVKGPLAAVLVLGPLALAAALRRPRPALAELGVARGLAVATAIAAVLYVPVGVLDRTYLDAFAATNLRRWAESSPHAAGPHYYVFWVPVLFLPWTLVAAPAVVRAWRDPGRRALVGWALFVPAFLTVPRGKLATYALSALVPLALVVGPDLARTALDGPPPEDRRIIRVAGALIAGALAVVGVLAVAVRAYPVPTAGRLALAATALAWAVVLAVVVRGERLAGVPVAILGAMLTLWPLAVRAVVPAVGALYSDRDLARLAANGGQAPVIAFGIRDPSLSLYLGSPALHTDDPALVRDVFAGDGPAFVVTSHHHFTEVETMLGDRASLWAETPRRRLYANRPPPGTQDRNGSR